MVSSHVHQLAAAAGQGLPYPQVQCAEGFGPVRDAEFSLVSVPTKMNYVTSETTVAHVYRDVSGGDSGITDCEWKSVAVQVHNARSLKCSIHENGFELLNEPISKSVDFLNTEQVINDYYPHCEDILKRVLGENEVTLVRAFDHNIRLSDKNGPIEKTESKLKGGGEAEAQSPLAVVHGDYTKDSGPRRLDYLSRPPKANDVLKRQLGEAPLLDPNMVKEALSGKRRFALINVWRSIDRDNAVQESPLACVDSTTCDSTDLRVLKIHYPDRIGENYFVTSNEAHKWCYFPQMTHSEAMLIKQWDSCGAFALGRLSDSTLPSTFAIHSAFWDPTSDAASLPRRSIEVRCAVIWEKD